jgi:hypothetical protein
MGAAESGYVSTGDGRSLAAPVSAPPDGVTGEES